MHRNTSIRHVGYLFRFMLSFEINSFSFFEVINRTIKARVTWAETGELYPDLSEEYQDIEWDIQKLENLEDALKLSEYLIDNKLISIDKIIINESDLLSQIGWEKSRFQLALTDLLNMRVDMVDDNERGDCFFLHF